MTISYKIVDNGKYTTVAFDIKDNIIDVNELKAAVDSAPVVDNTKGVCISGRGPVWLFTALSEKYHPTAFVSTFDPRLGGCVVTSRHVKGHEIGDIIVSVQGNQSI